jgi:hypothetical protein
MQQPGGHATPVVTFRTNYIRRDELVCLKIGHVSKLSDMATNTPARRRFLELLVSVAVLHAVAIALYYALDIPLARTSAQRTFAWTWMGLTVVVVLIGVQRLKRARRAQITARR